MSPGVCPIPLKHFACKLRLSLLGFRAVFAYLLAVASCPLEGGLDDGSERLFFDVVLEEDFDRVGFFAIDDLLVLDDDFETQLVVLCLLVADAIDIVFLLLDR